MLSAGNSEVGSDGVDGDLFAELGALRLRCAALREASTENQRAAALAQRESARLHADCRRSRGEILREQLPREPTAGAAARRLVEECLATASDDEITDARTVVSELVNNAFLHGEGRIELRLGRRRGRARIEVIDQGQGAVLRAGGGGGSHGLDIVDALSLTWGVGPGSTRIWAELPASGSVPRQGVDASRPGRR